MGRVVLPDLAHVLWLVRFVSTRHDTGMTEARTNRRLAAILAADVVGYSRLMANDEAGTLAALKRYRETIFDPPSQNTAGASSS